jgi:nicotinamide riboside transporter PnuC
VLINWYLFINEDGVAVMLYTYIQEYMVQILTDLPAILTDVFCGFYQANQDDEMDIWHAWER